MQGKKYRSKRSKLIYYANIMIVSSITLIVYGLVLYFTSGKRYKIFKSINK